MAVPDLPLWGWNLIIAMQRHEELHGKGDTCLDGVLDAVPAEVRRQAVAISTYVQLASGQQLADHISRTIGDLADGLTGKVRNEEVPQ
ncbi:hypothetical protein ACIQ7D_17680 [Streptomyces sp. NPDC096310]|uniref:hypothetical protein n=1 Tax=Streptomyces sp. NPDC096310 TaxID=3366082 RepID=UPI003808FF60